MQGLVLLHQEVKLHPQCLIIPLVSLLQPLEDALKLVKLNLLVFNDQADQLSLGLPDCIK